MVNEKLTDPETHVAFLFRDRFSQIISSSTGHHEIATSFCTSLRDGRPTFPRFPVIN
jgi:hypothetical protein